MSVFTGVIISLLSMLIVAFLQLKPSILMIFLHNASAKYSKKKVLKLTRFYFLGVAAMTSIVFMSICFIVASIFKYLPNFSLTALMLVIAAVLLIMGVLLAFFYFRRGQETKLYISRKSAKNLTNLARTVRSGSDAFALGVIAGIPELVLTLPIYILVATMVFGIYGSVASGIIALLLLVFATSLPLIIMHLRFIYHQNMAIIQRTRVKNKRFVSAMIGILYILLAVFVVMEVY